MFQFTGFALPDLCIQSGVTLAGRVSPFRYLRINAYLPAPRSFSQAITSFVACNRQGIHHMHLFAWPYNIKPSKNSDWLTVIGDWVTPSLFTHHLSPLPKEVTSVLFLRLAFVTISIRLASIWLDTIKTHVFHASAQWVTPSRFRVNHFLTSSRFLKNCLTP